MFKYSENLAFAEGSNPAKLRLLIPTQDQSDYAVIITVDVTVV